MRCSSSTSKQGIALVIVLGMMSLLVLIAVSFAIMMRTERKSANNFSQIVQGRQAALSALDVVIQEINYEDPDLTNVYTSIQWTTNAVDNIGEPSDLPSLAGAKMGGGFYTRRKVPATEASTWSIMPQNSVYQENNGILYAYFVINDSGLIDINHVLENSNINYRAFLSAADYNALLSAADPAIGFSYVHAYNNREVEYWGDQKGASVKFDNYFSPFSRYTQKYRDQNTGVYEDRVVLSGILSNETQIIDGLTYAGLTPAEASQAYTNLIDYTDSDNTIASADLLKYCAEAVPMISEVAVTGMLYNTIGTEYTVDCYVDFEVWFPFATDSTLPPVNIDWSGTTVSMTPPFGNLALVSSSNVVPSMDAMQVYGPLQAHYRGTHNFGMNPLNFGNLSASVQITLTDCDQTPQTTPLSFTLSPSPGASFGTESYKIDDPRLNGDFAAWDALASPIGIGETNGSPPESEYPLVVADREIQQVGELGFIGIGGGPWRSIDTTNLNKRVLDAFTVYTNKYQHGLINPNTPDRDVIEAALVNTNNLAVPNPAATNAPIRDAILDSFVLTNSDPNIIFEQRSDIANVIRDERVLAACSDLFGVNGNAFTVLLAVRTFKDNTSPSDPTPDGDYNPDHDATLSQRFLVAQFWRDPISKETKLFFLKAPRRDDTRSF
jgi:hypothetical protein